MSNRNVKRLIKRLVLLGLLFSTYTASSTILPDSNSWALIKSRSDQLEQLSQFKQQIVEAETVVQARKLAIEPTDQAIAALDKAQIMMPLSTKLQTAEARLKNGRSHILVASSQAQVADEFSGMMLAGLDDNNAASVNTDAGGCNYSTGEIIAIVVGLILGIIPGLILLVVLC
jgi:hypothetical protein